MPFCEEYSPELNLIVTVLMGRVHDRELLSAAANARPQQRLQPGCVEILDCRHALDNLQVTAAGLLEVARDLSARQSAEMGPLALLVRDDLQFGMANAFASVLVRDWRPVRVFRDVDEAIVWLDREETVGPAKRFLAEVVGRLQDRIEDKSRPAQPARSLHEYFSDLDFVLTVLRGQVTYQAAMQVIQSLDPAYCRRNSLRELADLCGGQPCLRMTPREVADLARFEADSVHCRDRKLALVTRSSELDQGLANLFATYSQLCGRKVAVFDDTREALTWLGLESHLPEILLRHAVMEESLAG